MVHLFFLNFAATASVSDPSSTGYGRATYHIQSAHTVSISQAAGLNLQSISLPAWGAPEKQSFPRKGGAIPPRCARAQDYSGLEQSKLEQWRDFFYKLPASFDAIPRGGGVCFAANKQSLWF